MIDYTPLHQYKKECMDRLIEFLFYGKSGRFSYLLSLMIVIIVFCFVFEYSNPDRCYVCNPVVFFPWRDLIEMSIMIVLGGVYFCLLLCWMAADERFFDGPVFVPIFITVFYLIQTIKRCYDIGESGWRFLIPIYSPLFLLFLPKEIEVDQEPVKSSVLMVLWGSKWLILTLVVICFVIYLNNQRYIHIHNAL